MVKMQAPTLKLHRILGGKLGEARAKYHKRILPRWSRENSEKMQSQDSIVLLLPS